jgi:hypothetical protein
VSLIDKKTDNHPIDIHIVNKAQKDSWGENTKPYFAIECKRINLGFSEYVEDPNNRNSHNKTSSILMIKRIERFFGFTQKVYIYVMTQ